MLNTRHDHSPLPLSVLRPVALLDKLKTHEHATQRHYKRYSPGAPIDPDTGRPSYGEAYHAYWRQARENDPEFGKDFYDALQTEAAVLARMGEPA